MLKKIENQIEEFTRTIKQAQGCDKLLEYMNNDYFSSIKLLILASKKFSLYLRILLFFVFTSTGLLMFSTIAVLPISSTLLMAVTLLLFVLTWLFVSHFRDFLRSSIHVRKSDMEEVQA